MGNHPIASSSELAAAPFAPGKRDVADRSVEASGSYSGAPNVGPGAGRSDELEQLGRPEERTAPPVEKDDRSKLRPDKLEQIRQDAGRGEPIAPVLYSPSQWNREGRTSDLISPISPQGSAYGTVRMVSSAPRCPGGASRLRYR